MKEYFKWIGLSFVDYIYNEENNLFDEPENCMFDIIVNIDHAMPDSEIRKLDTAIKPRFMEVLTEPVKSEKDLLNGLLQDIVTQFLQGETCQALFRLADIYNRYHMIDAIYEYTFVLLERMDDDMKERFYGKFDTAYRDVLSIINECSVKCTNRMGNRFTEYLLYAKYNCQRCMNAISLLRKRVLRFDVEKFLEEVNEIYKYDADYFNVEYLKAQVAQQDWQFKSFAQFYATHCIEKCPVNVCKSYHYYCLAKWKDGNTQPYEAGENYRLSYYYNKSNIKAIFKIAVEKKKLNDMDMSKIFLRMILALWRDEDDKNDIPLRDIEYAYKARMLLADIDEKQFQENYRKNADKYFEYVQKIRNDDDESLSEASFIKKMYLEKEVRDSICDAMMQRVYYACSISE